MLDEALVWAAKSDRVEVLGLLVELGAAVDADPYRGTALIWAAANGRTASIRELVALGADPNRRGTFGGPDHGEGVTALHLAAQAGRVEAAKTLLELGADPTIADALHDGTPSGWAEFGGHHELAALLALGERAGQAAAEQNRRDQEQCRAGGEPRGDVLRPRRVPEAAPDAAIEGRELP